MILYDYVISTNKILFIIFLSYDFKQCCSSRDSSLDFETSRDSDLLVLFFVFVFKAEVLVFVLKAEVLITYQDFQK